MTYSYDQVRAASLDYFKGDELAAEVFAKKYALQDLQGNYYELTPKDSHRRIAKELARIESNYPNPMSESDIFDLLDSWKFVVQGSPFSGIGNPYQIQSISNCFVVESPHDSYGGIFLTDQEQVQIMKRRGGVGHDISTIRPKGLPAANAARTTDGIAVFMDRFSNSTREVAQGGRRGALMMTLSVHHPEILTFIRIKKDRKRVTGANISIRVTDEFMKAVEANEEYEVRFPVDATSGHLVRERLSARMVWEAMMEAAWDSAEPGVLFWDRIISESPADCYPGYGTTSTNPCGELPLCPYDSCRLGLINLVPFVDHPFTSKADFDLESFGCAVRRAQRLMDDIVDLELEAIARIRGKISNDPEPYEVKQIEADLWYKIFTATARGRRTGLGITGLGDALAMMGLKYGSQKANDTAYLIYQSLAFTSYISSVEMAGERGAFPIFDAAKEADNPYINRIKHFSPWFKAEYERYGRRNIANLTTAPVGSLSTLTQTTSGIEPAIFLSYKRRRKLNPDDKDCRIDFVDPSGDAWQEYDVYHHGLQKWMAVTGNTDVTESPYYGATAEEIDWTKKVEMQAACQKWIDHSISNTTNLPESATVKDVSEVYMLGWKLGCKGITVYRAGSRTGVLVKAEPAAPAIRHTDAPKRPDVLPCDLHRASVKGLQYLIIVGLLDGTPYEVFAGLAEHVEIGKRSTKGTLTKHRTSKGPARYSLEVDGVTIDNIVSTFDDPNYGAMTRVISTALRHGVKPQYIVEQLRKDKKSDFTSFSSVVARVFSKSYIADGTKAAEKCVTCGSGKLVYQQGCSNCLDCGGSKCG
jgi:ribonucleoside-diphosphate reductase alpha chain